MSEPDARKPVDEPTSDCPDPRSFSDVWAWLSAAREWKGWSARKISLGAGLNEGAVAEILKKRIMPERPTFDLLADFFGVDRVLLRALHGTDPRRVAAGQKAAAKQGTEHMRAQAALARSKRNLTAEQWHSIGRAAGEAARRRNSPDEWRAMTAKGQRAIKAKRETGQPWFRTDETRDGASDRARVAGLKGGAATLARHGRAHFVQASKIASDHKRNGTWCACSICKDPDQLLYRVPSQTAGGRPTYHQACYIALRRRFDWRERGRILEPVYRELRLAKASSEPGEYERARGKLSELDRGWKGVLKDGDSPVGREVANRIRREVSRARPSRRQKGRPGGLAREIALAIRVATRHDDDEIPVNVIARELGLPQRKNDKGQAIAPGDPVFDWLRLGRWLRQASPPTAPAPKICP